MTANQIETLKTSIYNPKHIKHTKIHFDIKNIIFRKFMLKQNSALYVDFYGITSHVEGHTA